MEGSDTDPRSAGSTRLQHRKHVCVNVSRRSILGQLVPAELLFHSAASVVPPQELLVPELVPQKSFCHQRPMTVLKKVKEVTMTS